MPPMNEDPLPSLRDLLLRRDLTPDEERRVADWLARHPEAVSDWRSDLALGRSLRQLPPVPVPSNFTSRVLAEVRRQSPASAIAPRAAFAVPAWQRWLRSRLPALAGAAALVLAVSAGTWQWKQARLRREAAYAQQVSALRALANLSPTVLEDFDAIQRFDAGSPAVDFELLAALQ